MSNHGKWMGLAVVAPTVLAIGAFYLFSIFNESRSAARASIVKDELEAIEVAKQRFAQDKKKEGNVVPSWSDIVPYLDAKSKLASRGGKDHVGNLFIIGSIDDPVWVNPATMRKLRAGVENDLVWKGRHAYGGNVGTAPLHEAASAGKIELVTEALNKGGLLEARDEKFETALHRAAKGGHESVVKLLIEKGAKVNAKGWMNRTPLHYAAGEGHRAVLEFLIAQGADVNARDISNDTPLSYAFMSGKNDIVELLKKHRGR
jgi:hypothetical protein